MAARRGVRPAHGPGQLVAMFDRGKDRRIGAPIGLGHWLRLWRVIAVLRGEKVKRHGVKVLLFGIGHWSWGNAIRSIASASWWPRAISASIAAKVAGELENSVAD